MELAAEMGFTVEEGPGLKSSARGVATFQKKRNTIVLLLTVDEA